MVFKITQSVSPVGTNLKEGEVKKTSNVTDQDSSKPRNFVMEEKEIKVVKKFYTKFWKVIQLLIYKKQLYFRDKQYLHHYKELNLTNTFKILYYKFSNQRHQQSTKEVRMV